MRKSKLTALAAGLVAGGLVLAACGADDDAADDADVTAPGEEDPDEDEPDEDDPDEDDDVAATEWAPCDTTEGAAEIPDPEGTGDDETDLVIGIFDGWDESYASAYLFQAVLEDMGYSVSFEELEAGVTYAGVAAGDIDFMTDGWLPVTHPQYLDEYGDDMESLGCWYDNAKLTIAVNEDAPVQSLAELADYADEFDGSAVYGIDAGAGLTDITENEVFPTYELADGGWAFLDSSTPAMLAQLQASLDAGENVVVTLWHPHWAYDAFPIRDLEDPEGALGETEYIYNFGRSGFEADYPNVAQMLRNFSMTTDELAELENIMFSEDHYDGGDHEAAVAEWIADNQDFVDSLKAGTL
ncbi:glycine betaine ABC transporter substrate-binding protein [Phytoactinopolyspora mesophila]|uniref:Glycine/betaine ABC transporter substrate-binding protein n=1 Tax=Phytoactinopolyspora mesophila TaxID=2650750 RepID=A0A7K3M3Y3_9ACTN|nr:glycine betaine ABC transporter substrate-binding protein [Phytoactinopolyspora mesophila]NDL58019.1 glycine/betaine ABC transporter substrate-binding protein [Phytoactinopolyspora mesophila]